MLERLREVFVFVSHLLFFFSSRRRHTRCLSDWTDVCSSDLFGRLLPVGDDFFFPLPVLHLSVFRRPAVGNPVGLRVLGRSAGTPGKTDDDFYFEHFGERSEERRVGKWWWCRGSQCDLRDDVI